MQAQELLEVIKADRIHGATELTFIALRGVTEVTFDDQSVEKEAIRADYLNLIVHLQDCRPSMAVLRNLMQALVVATETIKARNVAEFRAALKLSCNAVIQDAMSQQKRAVDAMVKRIDNGDVIMTYSVSSTVKQVFTQVAKKNLRIIVPESRPGNEGKLMAAHLADLRLSTTYITESQINLFMSQVDKVIVGADTILNDGRVVNKSGTTLLALAAQYHHVPFYVCAEATKMTQHSSFEAEEMNSDEIECNIAGVTVRNIYFEALPAELITKIITGAP